MARPSGYPEWASSDQVDPTSGQNNKVEPPAAWKTYGWSYQEKPPRNYDNWQKWSTYKWIEYLDTAIARAATIIVAAVDADDESKYHADYVCDGTDDHSQINSAINSVPAAGGVVMLTEGTFTVDGTITMDNNVHLVGRGMGATKIQVYSGAITPFAIITGTDADHWSLRDLTLDGNENNLAGTFYGMVAVGARKALISDVEFHSHNDLAAHLDSCQDVILSRCVFTLNSATGLVVENDTAATDLALTDSYPDSNQDSGQALYSGATTATAQSVTGDGNKLTSVKFDLQKVGSPTGAIVAKLYAHSGTFGTSSVPTGAALATSRTIDVSTLSPSTKDGYTPTEFIFDSDQWYTLVNATKYCIAVEYSGGDASNYAQVGYDASSPSHGGNKADYNGSWSAQSGQDLCFFLYTGIEQAITVEACHFVQNLNLGAKVEHDGKNVTFKACHFRLNGGGGLNVTGNNCTANACQMSGNTLAGLYLAGNYNQVIGCQIIGNGDDGIGLTNADYNTISSCTISLNALHGIDFTTSDNNNVIGCMIHQNSQDTDNTYHGVNFDSGSGTNVIASCVVRLGAASPQQHTGIALGSSTTNRVVACDLYNGGATSTVSGSGKTIPAWTGSAAGTNVQDNVVNANRTVI